MRIIHCVNQYMPDALAGTEVYTHTLAKLQQEDGNEVAVVIPYFKAVLSNEKALHYVYDTINVFQFHEPSDSSDRNILYGFKKPEGIKNFRQLIDELKPDVIHFHQLNRSIGFTADHVSVAKSTGAKTVLTMHLSSYTCNTNVMIYKNQLCDGKIRLFNCTNCYLRTIHNTLPLFSEVLTAFTQIASLLKLSDMLPDSKAKTFFMVPEMVNRIKRELQSLVHNVDHFVCIASWYKDVLLKNGVPASKLSFIPQGVAIQKKNLAEFAITKAALPLKVVFVGRIQPTKGIDIIISAAKRFTKSALVIDFFGKEEDSSYYKRCREESAGVENINWNGALQMEAVIPALKNYDIFCLASTFSEMSPLVIQESFAAGLPVLASKVYGNMEQIEDGVTGLLFDFNSVDDLQLQLQKLIDQPSLIDVMRSNIKPPHSFIKLNEQYNALYHS